MLELDSLLSYNQLPPKYRTAERARRYNELWLDETRWKLDLKTYLVESL